MRPMVWVCLSVAAGCALCSIIFTEPLIKILHVILCMFNIFLAGRNYENM